MKKQLSFGLATVLCAVGASVFAGGDHGADKPQMYCVYKEVVKPGMVQQYEAACKQMISEFRAYQIDPEKINFHTVSGPELGYLWVTPIDDWAGMTAIHDGWMQAMATIGEDKFMDMMAPAFEATESIDVFHAVRRDDLSYQPENPRVAHEDIKYVHYGFYYAQPGKTEEIEAAAKEFAALYKSKGIDSGWVVFQPITGPDLPVYVVAVGAKSAADYYNNREKNKDLLGEEAEAIGRKVYAVLRRAEYKEGTLRPDLSYPGPDHGPRTD